MPSDADRVSIDEWKARIEPHLSSSLQTVSDQITHSSPVQAWLRKASTEAAEGLGQSGMPGEMRGYMQLTEDLESTFPNLVEAVEDLTDGWGRLDVEWRPLSPTQSRLYIRFDRTFTPVLFCRLEDCSQEAAQAVLNIVAEALPESDPFPKRPHTVTGLVAHRGTALGVRVKEHRHPEQGRYRTVTLLPNDQSPLENQPFSDAPRALRQFFCAPSSSST